jgi:hypothetical protein
MQHNCDYVCPFIKLMALFKKILMWLILYIMHKKNLQCHKIHDAACKIIHHFHFIYIIRTSNFFLYSLIIAHSISSVAGNKKALSKTRYFHLKN